MPNNYNRGTNYFSETNTDGTQAGVHLVTQIRNAGEYKFQPRRAAAVVMQEQNVAEGPVISIGTNNPDYNNLVNARQISSVVGCIDLPMETILPLLAGPLDLVVKVVTPCVAEPQQIPTLEFRVIVEGMEI